MADYDPAELHICAGVLQRFLASNDVNMGLGDAQAQRLVAAMWDALAQYQAGKAKPAEAPAAEPVAEPGEEEAESTHERSHGRGKRG